MTNEREPDADDTVLERFGIRPAFVAEEGPPVDRQLLREYAKGKLGAEEKKLVEAYVASFRNWFDDFFDVVVDEDQA